MKRQHRHKAARGSGESSETLARGKADRGKKGKAAERKKCVWLRNDLINRADQMSSRQERNQGEFGVGGGGEKCFVVHGQFMGLTPEKGSHL
jgi:hypothetical protein